MNKIRRKRLAEAIDLISQARLVVSCLTLSHWRDGDDLSGEILKKVKNPSDYLLMDSQRDELLLIY